MKKLLFFLIPLTVFCIGCNDNDDELICNYVDFKYYNDSMNFIGELSRDYILIACDTTYDYTDIQDFISKKDYFDPDYIYSPHSSGNYKFTQIPLKFNESQTCEEMTNIIVDLEANDIVAYTHYAIQADDCSGFIPEPPLGNLCVNSYSSLFYIKVFEENDLTDLNNMITQTNTELVGPNIFMPQWFTVRATKDSEGDALHMANYFYESGLFEASEPDIIKLPVE